MPENTGVAVCGPYKWLTTPESGTGTTWTTYNSQTFADGPGGMLFDATNHIVYANLQCSGIWKLSLGANATPVKTAHNAHAVSTGQSAGAIHDLRGRLIANNPAAAKAMSGIRAGASNVYIVKMSNSTLQKMIQSR